MAVLYMILRLPSGRTTARVLTPCPRLLPLLPASSSIRGPYLVPAVNFMVMAAPGTYRATSCSAPAVPEVSAVRLLVQFPLARVPKAPLDHTVADCVGPGILSPPVAAAAVCRGRVYLAANYASHPFNQRGESSRGPQHDSESAAREDKARDLLESAHNWPRSVAYI